MLADELRILNSATPPPFAIEEDAGADEAARLAHRVHDLRRPPLQRALRLRHELYQAVRASLCAQGFLEIETPILTKSTPEGARDFLVPSRLQPGAFYALPQSPQIMKQLLMVAGFDRYFQIARCFRDEDQRADRQLEFTQVDLEIVVRRRRRRARGARGGDRGGLRGGRARAAAAVPAHHLSRGDGPLRHRPPRHARRSSSSSSSPTCSRRAGSARSAQAVDAGGIVKCLPVHDADELSRGEIDKLEAFVKKELGGKGLAWIRVERRRRRGSRRSRSSSPTRSARRSRERTRRASRQRALLPGRRARARERDPRAPARRPRRAARPRRRPRARRAVRGRLPALRARREGRAHLRAPAVRGAARRGPPAARDAIPARCAARTTTW